MFEEVKIRCPFCFEKQTLMVDSGGGETQQIVTDCEVCCHPLDVSLFWNEDRQKYKASVEKSSGF